MAQIIIFGAGETAEMAFEYFTHDSPHQVVVSRLQSERVVALLQKLTADRREAVSMRLFAGLTARETGAVMGKSEAAVKMLIHRALRELRDALHEEVGDVR